MTDQPLKRDVLIHYDEEKDEIAFYTLDVAATARARANSFDGARLGIEELLSDGPDEAERRLGAGVLSLLEAFSGQPTGVRDYAAEAAEAHNEYQSDLRVRAETGDTDAQYHLAMDLLRQGRQTQDVKVIEEADKYFQSALRSGLEKAVKTESVWPRMLASARGAG